MPYYPPEIVEKARQMDLLTYLKMYEPQELVFVGGNTYCTREHDSLKISNGKWCWFSRGIGGRTALDYLIKVKELPFTEAVGRIVGETLAALPPYHARAETPKEKVLLLPPVNRSATFAFHYLLSRGIDEEILRECISTGRLYESGGSYHNVVFVGHDLQGKARYASIRGIGTDFKGECTGSDKRYSFHFSAPDSDTLHLFESAIDLLSFATLQKLQGQDWRRDHLLSLAGVYQPKKEGGGRLPLALQQYLSDYPQVRRVELRLDSDFAGKLAADAIKALLQKQDIKVDVRLPPQGKDYNEYLCMQLNIPITRQQERKRER